jgi:histidinol-phosphate aminotransferase
MNAPVIPNSEAQATIVRNLRPEVKALDPYHPVVPIELRAARMGRAPEDIIKLDANENPYGPPPPVLAALRNLDYIHLYPDPQTHFLREALAEFTGVSVDLLVAGAGSDELLTLIKDLFLNPGDVVVNCPPTFGMYPFETAIAGARVVAVPRRDDFSLDMVRIEEVVAQTTPQPKLIFVASPNNPDGSWVSDADLERLLALPIVVVLDEAYVEFVGQPKSTRITQVAERENLIVLRTFSKWAGLAGLRVGYGAFPAALMRHLWKIKQPYTVSIAAQRAAMAVLGISADYLPMHRARIVAERERLVSLLSEVSYLSPYPSQANFVLCRVAGGRDAGNLKVALEGEGILVRYFNKPGLRNYIRISVGRPEQTEALIAALKRM